MAVLYEKTYEREGNDSWLIDRVKLCNDYNFGLHLERKYKYTGWVGDDKGDHTLELDIDDLDASQKKLDEYIDEHSLYHEWTSGSTEGIKINLKELLNIEEDDSE